MHPRLVAPRYNIRRQLDEDDIRTEEFAGYLEAGRSEWSAVLFFSNAGFLDDCCKSPLLFGRALPLVTELQRPHFCRSHQILLTAA